MFTSEKISAKDFVERLNSDKLEPGSIIFGKVKKSGNDSEILFAFKGDKMNWTKIPVNMIEHVHLIKSFMCGGEKMALVKMHLKTPSDPEARLFHDLLSALEAKVIKWHIKKMMSGEGGCGSGKMYSNHGEHCGQTGSCEWGSGKNKY